MFGMSDLSSAMHRATVDEVGDVDGDREAHVVAAAVVAELRVGLIGVREEVVRRP